MIIVEYRNTSDIDVKFANGAVKSHVLYQNFKADPVKNLLSNRRISQGSHPCVKKINKK